MLRRKLLGEDSQPMAIGTRIALLIGLLWVPLALLTLVEGTFWGDAVAVPFLKDVVPQVRLLLAMPLLVAAHLVIDPGITEVVHNLQRSGVIPGGSKPQFDDALRELERGRDAVWPDVVMLVLAYLLSFVLHPGYDALIGGNAASSWRWWTSGEEVGLTGAGYWYALVSAPVFQLILYRWVWRFLIWARFLFQVSRVPFTLHATHPDRSGGMGVLGRGQQTFVIVFVAFACVMASTVAHNIFIDGIKFHESRPEIMAFIAVCIVVIYSPLLFFVGDLYRARRRGLSEYGALGHRLSEAFYSQWIQGASSDVGAQLKSSPDPSTLADYAGAFDTVRQMRVIPVTFRGIVTVAIILAIPFLPLYLTEVSLTDLMQKLADSLV